MIIIRKGEENEGNVRAENETTSGYILASLELQNGKEQGSNIKNKIIGIDSRIKKREGKTRKQNGSIQPCMKEEIRDFGQRL